MKSLLSCPSDLPNSFALDHTMFGSQPCHNHFIDFLLPSAAMHLNLQQPTWPCFVLISTNYARLKHLCNGTQINAYFIVNEDRLLW